MSSNITNEQPMSKRQKIDAADNSKKSAFGAISNGIDSSKHHINENSTPPDILPMTKHENKGTTTATATNTNTPSDLSSTKSTTATATATTTTTTTTETVRSASQSPSDELDNAAVACNPKSIVDKINAMTDKHSHCIAEFPDLLKTSPEVASTSRSHEVFASTLAPGCSSSSSNGNGSTNNHRTSSTNSQETSSRLSSRDSNSFSRLSNIDEFQLYLMKQCLCDIDGESLRRAFATHYYEDMNGMKYNVPLKEWPAHELIQFLSNMELLFEVYLNQNAKGEICTRIMQVCDKLLTKAEIINGIFELDEYNNKFVQYLAIKVLANCLLITKDKEEFCQDLLDTLMSNLVIPHQPNHLPIHQPIQLDHRALGKISFILGIILHIMEWKDIKKHPLDDQIVINGREVYNDSDNENFTLPANIPPIENNYFSVHYGTDETETALAPTPPDDNHSDDGQSVEHDDRQSNASQRSIERKGCLIQVLKDSESFDSNHLKVSILYSLKSKWCPLVNTMKRCVQLLQTSRNLHYIENTVITFLTLWERIISVDTCIEYDSTYPFHEFLALFGELLIQGNLSVQVYKQILTLFSASLCYTTTLALQPEVPAHTNQLAAELFNSVRSQRIFSSLPTFEVESESNISFIGYKHLTIVYDLHADRLKAHDSKNDKNNDRNGDADNDDDDDEDDDDDDDDDDEDGSEIDLELREHFNKSIDFTLLQKLVLLILKAIAVTVRPIGGGDSSDSSMDSCSSTSSSAETSDHEWSFVEHATRDAVEKLLIFLRNKLNFHPETHLSKVIVHLFSNQDDYLLEAMLCMLGTTIAFLPRHQPFGPNRQAGGAAANERPQFRMFIEILSPVYTFLEFLELIQYGMQTMLDFLITDETCFLLYFLRFLKYIRSDWTMFQSHCNKWQSSTNSMRINSHSDKQPYKRVMDVLISLRVKLERLVMHRLFPYDISPLLLLMRQCESFYEGNYEGLF